MATTYTFRGFKVTYDGDTSIALTDTIATLWMQDGVAPVLTYSFVGAPVVDDLTEIDATIPGLTELDIGPLDGLTQIEELYQGFVTASGQTYQILDFFDQGTGSLVDDYLFVIGGDTITDFGAEADPLAAFQAFEASIGAVGANLSGPFGPGSGIPLSSLPGAIMSTNVIDHDILGDETIMGGSGSDMIAVEAASAGVGSEVDIYAGAGDDVILLSEDLIHYIDTGTGNDIVDMSYVSESYDVWTDLYHDGLSGGILANIDGATNSARIWKPGDESTVLIDVAKAMWAGFFIGGTEHSDVFNLTVAEFGWMGVNGGPGSDTYNIFDHNGTIRLDYRFATTGIVADLAAGTVEDGFGGTDTITGIGNDGWFELRGTDNADMIVGSAANEGFILRQGDDTLDGGAGSDMVRYDRNNVSAVNVDLEAGTATGIWDGVAFSHSLSSIENIRGSRDDADTLAGNGVNNYIQGRGGNDTILGRGGDDTLVGESGDDSIDGGDGYDRAEFWGVNQGDATITELSAGVVQVVSSLGTDVLTGVEELGFSDSTVQVSDLFPIPGEIVGSGGGDTLSGGDDPETLIAGGGDDRAEGGGGNDTIDGGSGNDTLIGGSGDDSLFGGPGNDRLNGGDGNDEIIGGNSDDDLRDEVYGGAGHDNIDAGYGNDLVYGQDGNDTISGGFGADDLQGQNGNDVISGGALSDLIYGGAGDDFINGGFGYDRINGGSGADKFFHLGVFDHGSDWIQDYQAGEGDVLVFGNTSASADDFQVNFAHTANDAGERSGDDDVAEGFVIYRPTGQIMWALVDGAGQDEINLKIGGDVFDLLA